MKSRAAILLLALLGVAPAVSAQAGDPASPEWVVEMFYARPEFPQLAAHVTGEFAAHYAGAETMGARLPASVTVTSRALRREAERAIFATSLRDEAHAQDWYTFLRREGGVWKIEAVRTLALPPLHFELLDRLGEIEARGELPDSLAAELAEMRLAAASDSALRANLVAHEPAFRALAEHFAAARGLQMLAVDGPSAGAVPDDPRRALVAELRALHLRALLRDPAAPGCLFLKIGGSEDNEVGYIRAGDGCTPPPISPDRFIYVEAVAPGWYVYKTT